ncbi:TrkH family potassium uptake protein [Rhodohalobacter sp.]|uniref:TrkH family potassium uptake protein n=1 Tax=Rhodohalobacter sp. TaxID=1974210 RepID=UPI00356B1B8B
MRYNIPYHWRKKAVEWRRSFNKYRRKFYLRYQYLQDDLYEFNRKANPWLHGISILLTITVFLSLLVPLLLPEGSQYYPLALRVDEFLLLGFGIYFYLRLLFSNDKLDFLTSRWPEGVAASLALIFGLELLLLETGVLISFLSYLGISNADSSLLVIIQVYLVLLVLIKLIQRIPQTISDSKNPARLVLLSFLFVIVVGTMLLMLPASTADQSGLDFVNALFMATSAVCVTGLIVVDTATHLSFFGQGVILVLIQLGGIGVITFATFLAMYLSGKFGSTQRETLSEIISGEDVQSVSKTLKHIIILTFTIELIGFFGFYLSWSSVISDTGERIWFSLFHSISAFCNAGFSVYTNSLADPINATSIPINVTTMVLIILGGLGFTTIWESIQKISGKTKHRNFTIHSIIVFRMTGILIVAGTLLVLLLEWNGVLADYSAGDKFLASLFQSVTSRTAGFNTIDTGALTAGTTLIVILLMIIGAAPSSTAGGLKITTVYILFKSMFANITGSDRIEVAGRTVPSNVVFRAITSVLLANIVLGIGLILLTIFEDFQFMDLLFEQISAFMTVGLSRGITGGLTDPGKIVIVFSMFAGRVGMLTVAVAFAQKISKRNYKYPEESVMVA